MYSASLGIFRAWTQRNLDLTDDARVRGAAGGRIFGDLELRPARFTAGPMSGLVIKRDDSRA